VWRLGGGERRRGGGVGAGRRRLRRWSFIGGGDGGGTRGMPNFCLWKGTWDLVEPDSTNRSLDEPILQTTKPERPETCLSPPLKHESQARNLHKTCQAFHPAKRRGYREAQTRQTNTSTIQQHKMHTKRRLMIGPTPPPPPIVLSSSTLLPSLLIYNPQSPALPLQRPCTPLRL